MPKERASKLVPKYVGPYKVMKVITSSSNYELELPAELVRRRIHPRFHVSLLRPHQPNNDALFLNRKRAEPYDFGTPDDAKWTVDKLVGHQWKGRKVEFLMKWNLGDSTWEPLENCNELAILDNYWMLMDVKDWKELPKKGDKDVRSKHALVRHVKELIKQKKGNDQDPQRQPRQEAIQGSGV
jgi:hypothetical protein